MAKKTTLNEHGAMIEHVVKHMATKEDIASMATKEDIADIRKEMATKEDIAELKLDISGIRSDLRDIKARLKEIESAVKDHAGHSKEIDHALVDVTSNKRFRRKAISSGAEGPSHGSSRKTLARSLELAEAYSGF